MKILLGRGDVKPDNPNNDDVVPPDEYLHHSRVPILSSSNEWCFAYPKKLDNRGRTPLWWATAHHHAGVMELLLLPLGFTTPSAN